MKNIPDFFDNYHLPDGLYECTIEEIEQRFLFSEKRIYLWGLFKNLINRLIGLGLKPKALLIDGSFVTGREEPGDVDFAALIPPPVIEEALKTLDEHDKHAIFLFMSPENQTAIRSLFGTHLLLADTEDSLNHWVDFFRTGGANGKLRDRDPERDPDWVIVPQSKGILKVYLDGGDI
ncbi:DUF6932 family protein [Paenibacillus crassostreae]|uniref:Uncharacterized protein n=1 Tax=Paenibacillus crassostreae TaxID=1763538 RepID=A0A167C5S3_9BACL|nr:hypothetical protein [Paenibacillus crassostreae]AOZ91615.1 hypothetical protein LPB68_04880 [Paenibacillus crassostreae]OAB72811.1 hypothetical protein PNBC_15370 [Paenibacillus crassostreae]